MAGRAVIHACRNWNLCSTFQRSSLSSFVSEGLKAEFIFISDIASRQLFFLRTIQRPAIMVGTSPLPPHHVMLAKLWHPPSFWQASFSIPHLNKGSE
ncbi:hypothetical protein CEXT_220171 [Caerostris extrusa]|uniref:Uncharacterized protein n=1 Tax=Caerostris extrusa TaxID=172846 RepID=A0AAV4MMT8_CAEEX|nr:hypothetical protein CEXT_220171 [Caerostris extrusa]